VNALENWFCSTAFWSRITQRSLLPWILSDIEVGDHLLELGSGPGAATRELIHRAPRVTSIEYSHAFAAKLGSRLHDANPNSSRAAVLQGDAAALPFADGSFPSAIVVLMLHHLRSVELQRRVFSEIHRVLRPGGVFIAFEIQDGWLQRAIHLKSTFVPVRPTSLPALLSAAGFTQVKIEERASCFRLSATSAA
jgi:SAM-dependent methyltransferase